MKDSLKSCYEEIKISSLSEIIDIIKNYQRLLFFRGQSDVNWKLIPKLARMFNNLIPSDSWDRIESFMLEDFRKYSIPYLVKEPINDLEWLVLAQHYGLPTRLLDWTTNPLKAIFFAVSEKINDADGALIGICPSSGLRYIDKSHSLENLDYFISIFPNMIDNRIIAQESCFTLFPLPNEKSKFKPLEDFKFYEGDYYHLLKVIIPKKIKLEILKDLNTFGINHRTLFPDLEGLSKYISWRFSGK